MKARHLAALTTLLILCALTSAQGYFVRIAYNTNLRADASLDASIIETAPAGTALSVVGQSGRWLKISRNGGEVWMANWVSYSRVDGSGAPTSHSGALEQIDNCCFVDRQCNGDEEWTDGYWAFQNGQCPAPSSSQPNSSAPPANSAPANVDNCCFVDRQCQTGQDWTDGYWAYQNGQCGSPSQARHIGSAFIDGSATFIAQISAALDLLKRRAPRWHAYVTKGPQVIRESQPGSPDGYAAGDTIYISPSAAAKPAHVLAELLVHEACHVQSRLSGLYGTVYPWKIQDYLPEYVSKIVWQKLTYGRVVMTYSPAQVARLIRNGYLEQRVRPGVVSVTYISAEVRQWLREGIDFFGAVRTEIARANSLLS